MKKNFFKFAAMMATVLSASAFVSCSEDDEDQIGEGQEIVSFKLYDRFGNQIGEMNQDEMDVWKEQQEFCADYWYEYQVEGSDKVYSGHFTMLK